MKVSVISLGGWLTYGKKVSGDGTFECIEAAVKAGVNFLDTAEVYAAGQSEIEMGKAIKRLGVKRSDLVISTKIFWGGKGPNDCGLSRKHIIEGLDASLQRLQLDYVDLVFAHRPDMDTPLEETVRAFNHVINQGKALYWGTSEWSAREIAEANMIAQRLGLVGPVMEQPQYNMFERTKVEKEYLTIYRDYGLGTTTWSPLASGVLTGKYNNGIPEGSRFSHKGDHFVDMLSKRLLTDEGKRQLEIVKKLEPIAKKVNATLAQLAIAWVIKNPNVSTVITGASNVAQFNENLKALEISKHLHQETMDAIEEILGNKPPKEHNFK